MKIKTIYYFHCIEMYTVQDNNQFYFFHFPQKLSTSLEVVLLMDNLE